MDLVLVNQIMEKGVGMVIAAGMLWIYWKRMGVMTTQLGEILGILRRDGARWVNPGVGGGAGGGGEEEA